jgi:acetyltransferase EpsM
MKIAIVGAGGHGQALLDILQQQHPDSVKAVFFDDRYEEIGFTSECPVLGPISAISRHRDIDAVFVAIGENKTRRAIQQQLERLGKTLETVIHPHTAISPRAQLGAGTVAVAGVVVNSGAVVGRGVILNTLSSVGHGCHVGDFAQLAPGVNLGGDCVVGEGAFLGIGAKVGPRAHVGDWCIVGAGSVVLKDLPERHFCVGIPAQALRPLTAEELP